MSWETNAWHWCITSGPCYIEWADHWQTMITGCLAVGAAGVAAVVANKQLGAARDQSLLIKKQIDSQQSEDADRRRRILRAARASLPSVLTSICHHSSIVAERLRDSWPAADLMYHAEHPAAHAFTVKAQIPLFPTELVEPLQKVVEYADDDDILKRIGSIFREAQVLDARTRPLSNGAIISVAELADYILEAVVLYARAESLFSFSRGQSETIDEPDLWPRVMAAINLLNINIDMVKERAVQERDQGLPPGEAEGF